MDTQDILVVGAGLFGSVFSRVLTDYGHKVKVIDVREHIGGNIYTKRENNIDIHVYGPHIFHTNSEKIWNFVNSYTKFNQYKHTGKVSYKNKLYSFPINLFTLYQLFGVSDPNSAMSHLDTIRLKHIQPDKDLESYCLHHLGEQIYETFIKGYTKKQWGKDPSELPSAIIKRLPIKFNYDDNYYNAIYQGIPNAGYTDLISNLLDGIDVELGIDFITNRQLFEKHYRYIIYTGALDKLFNYQFGMLEWRSLRFKHTWKDMNDYQGCSMINYTDESVPYTRICEHKHFNYKQTDKTIITEEYPDNYSEGKEQYYPINTDRNNELQKKYLQLLPKNYIIGGRLGSYQYYDMDQVIGQALTKANEFVNGQ